MAQQAVSKIARAQARAIHEARGKGRSLSAWNVRLASGENLLVLATTDRGARSIAAEGSVSVVRVGPAHVRDLAALEARALAAVPEPASAVPGVPRPIARQLDALCRAFSNLSRPVAGPSRDALRDFLVTGEGPRVALPEPKHGPRIPGMPRIVITAQPRKRFVGQPIAGEYSLRAA